MYRPWKALVQVSKELVIRQLLEGARAVEERDVAFSQLLELLDSAPIVEWHRVQVYQDISLRRLAREPSPDEPRPDGKFVFAHPKRAARLEAAKMKD